MEYILLLWGATMISLLAIGGFFMFRKFLKKLPKDDGKSAMDWEVHYYEKTKHMWEQEAKDLLEELVTPVPELFRDVARHRIASKIGERALTKQESHISKETLIEGYILATPKRDHKFLRKKLKEKKISTAPYEAFFLEAKANYAQDWEKKYKQTN